MHWRFRAVLLVIGLCLVAQGMFARHKIVALVPKECMHEITITDFTKPCKVDPKNPNAATCDGVKIRFACLQYKTQ